MDQFINTLHSILGTASRLTLHSSIGDILDVLIGLGIMSAVSHTSVTHTRNVSRVYTLNASSANGNAVGRDNTNVHRAHSSLCCGQSIRCTRMFESAKLYALT